MFWGCSDLYFVYDEAGRLLGEYDATGAPIQETVWLGDVPVAVMKPATPSGFTLYYVWADHLGTPRMISDTSNQARWEWAHNDPFGNNLPDENPAGAGAFSFNLRFPGQYYDAETGKHYNYFRDYDPSLARYVQSDPIGLGGGLNTYLYVVANPLTISDPTGEQGRGRGDRGDRDRPEPRPPQPGPRSPATTPGERESCYADCVNRRYDRQGKPLLFMCIVVTAAGGFAGKGAGLAAGLGVSAGILGAFAYNVHEDCKKDCW